MNEIHQKWTFLQFVGQKIFFFPYFCFWKKCFYIKIDLWIRGPNKPQKTRSLSWVYLICDLKTFSLVILRKRFIKHWFSVVLSFESKKQKLILMWSQKVAWFLARFWSQQVWTKMIHKIILLDLCDFDKKSKPQTLKKKIFVFGSRDFCDLFFTSHKKGLNAESFSDFSLWFTALDL